MKVGRSAFVALPPQAASGRCARPASRLSDRKPESNRL